MIDKFPKGKPLSYDKLLALVENMNNALWWISPLVNKDCGKREPPAEHLYDGLLAYANGTDWDPAGTGAKGMFRYNTTTSAWVNVG